jgi:hypothetical protein
MYLGFTFISLLPFSPSQVILGKKKKKMEKGQKKTCGWLPVMGLIGFICSDCWGVRLLAICNELG